MKYRRRSKGDGRRMKEDFESVQNRIKMRIRGKRRSAYANQVIQDQRFDGGVAKKFLCDEEGR